ncbi:MAG: hypothetical protein J5507_06020 [Clostridia bacterium]|nr:hypothetical protein [Clostridia bacterium]
MKRILLYILCMVFLCFMIPVLFTKHNKTIEDNIEDQVAKEVYQDYDYGSLNKVKLLHTTTRRNRRTRIR